MQLNVNYKGGFFYGYFTMQNSASLLMDTIFITRGKEIFHNFKMIKEFMLERAIMPDEIIDKDGKKIIIPDEYKKYSR